MRRRSTVPSSSPEVVKLWSFPSSQLLGCFGSADPGAGRDQFDALTVNADGTLIAWKAAGNPTSVAFGPGHLMAVGRSGGSVEIARDFSCFGIAGRSSTVAASVEPIVAVSFAADGQQMAALDRKGALQIYRLDHANE
jgi:hypothetical protein